MRKQLSQSILLLLCCLLLLTLPALAQTPEPTLAATPDATAEAPSPAPVETPVEPVIVVDTDFDNWYVGIIAQLIDLIKWAVVAGGGYAITKAWRNPEQGKQYVSFGLGVFELVAKLTPTKKDDELFKDAREWWENLIKDTKEVAAQAAKAGVKELIDEERAKPAVKTLDFAPPPPTNPVS